MNTATTDHHLGQDHRRIWTYVRSHGPVAVDVIARAPIIDVISPAPAAEKAVWIQDRITELVKAGYLTVERWVDPQWHNSWPGKPVDRYDLPPDMRARWPRRTT